MISEAAVFSRPRISGAGVHRTKYRFLHLCGSVLSPWPRETLKRSEVLGTCPVMASSRPSHSNEEPRDTAAARAVSGDGPLGRDADQAKSYRQSRVLASLAPVAVPQFWRRFYGLQAHEEHQECEGSHRP